MTKLSLTTGRRWRWTRRQQSLRLIGGVVGIAAIAVACRTAPEASSPDAPSSPVPETTEQSTAPPPAETNTAEAPGEDAPVPAVAADATERIDPVSPEKQDCGQLATQSDINTCARANYTVSDRSLNQVYQTLRSTLSSEDKAKLTTAEQAWIEFRDAQCEFERSRFDGGSIAPLILSSCLEQITDLRIDELRAQTGSTQSYEAADTRLNQVYQELRAVMDASVWPRFQAVQVDWLAYRDANCTYEADATLFTEEQCLSRMTALRTSQLEQQLEQWSL
ncbi:MAG: lysozyme inhibitor LprI family protein [Cyanobacteria bacterium J06632_22]